MNETADLVVGAYFKGFLNGILAIWYVWVFLLVAAIIKYLIRLWELKRLANSGIDDIDKMDGKTFEKYLEALFKKLGYKVERTRYVGDYGADLVVWRNGTKTVIQAKRYKQKVGVKAIQEAVAAKGYYSCVKAMVVTNSFYTKQAIELAKANDVQLWDRNDLVKALLSVKNENVPEPLPVVDSNIEINSNNEVATTMEVEEIAGDACVICGEVVSEKVKQYCITHSERFGGRIYCFQHQKEVKS
ncbi:MAG: restriction endonuclease [Syntrophomonadaceae bacterium]|nr:restriction endonuclease [Syntrophomonadaceae bacterium]